MNPKSTTVKRVLQKEIKKLSARYPRYGYRRITEELLRMGYTVGYRQKENSLSHSTHYLKAGETCVSQTVPIRATS